MSLISQAGPSYGIRSEITPNKTLYNGFRNVANIKGISQLRASCIGFPSSTWNSPESMQLLQIYGTVGCKRGHQFVVAASPPTEDAVIATEPLTKEDLVRYLASGCKTKEKWRFNF